MKLTHKIVLAAAVALTVATVPDSHARNRKRAELPQCQSWAAHNACSTPILETPEFTLHWSSMTRSEVGLFQRAHECYYVDGTLAAAVGVNLAMVFKTTDPDFAVVLDEAYRKRFEKEILPAIARLGCKGPKYEFVYVAHYLDGVLISGGTGPIYTGSTRQYANGTPPGIYQNGEIPLSSIHISFEGNKPRYDGTIQSPLGKGVPTSLASLSEDRSNRQELQAAVRRARAEYENRRMERSFEDLREGLKKLGTMMEPVTTAADDLEQAIQEPTGVFYQYDLRKNASRGSVTLCNESNELVRVAAAIEHSPRSRTFDPSIDTEVRVRGWGELPPKSCKSVVTSAGNAAIVRMETMSGGKATPALYKTDGDAADADLSKPASRILYTKNIIVCARREANFDIRASTLSGAGECQEGQVRTMFPYLLQFGDQRYTVTLK